MNLPTSRTASSSVAVAARIVSLGLALLLVVLMVALVYGHTGGSAEGLSLAGSYVSEYEARAPHWPWIIVAIFVFAVVLMLLACAFLLWLPRTILITLGCALFAAASLGLFFVAYAPMRRVEQPPVSAQRWWTPRWWFTSHTSRSPYEHGMADAYADVHYHAIKLVLVTGLTGMVLLGSGLLLTGQWQGYARFTIAAAVVMTVLFWAGDQVPFQHGLWQRLGVGLMYLWLWAGRWRVGSAICEEVADRANP